MLKGIDLKANSNKEFFLIHGYTGNAYDFNEFPNYLHQEFEASVKIPTLPGHSTRIGDLDSLRINDFIRPLEKALKKELDKGKEIILGGVSFGAQLAILLAAKYPVKGLLVLGVPYSIKYPFSLPLVGRLRYYKKYWKKPLLPYEIKLRQGKECYSQMHINGLGIIKKANRRIVRAAKKIHCPALIVHSKYDPIGKLSGAAEIEAAIPAKIKQLIVLNNKNHNMFFCRRHEQVYGVVARFFADMLPDSSRQRERVSAIIPAYNEAKRIASVLQVLTNTEIINEVIVVDDGSSDNTGEVVSRFPRAIYLRNKKNMGKSYAMDRGVRAAKSEIIFFCDADLSGLTPVIASNIISPVKNGDVDMFIGLRANIMQKTVHLFALNSGERALRKEIWEDLPEVFKHRYRVEAGLNYIVKKTGRRYASAQFDYFQKTKEKKYGFLRGTWLRWWMNIDVGYAYLVAMLDRLTINKK